MNFSLLSPARAATKEREGKAQTIVVVECDGSIYERQEGEVVHLSDVPGLCKVCGLAGWTWTDSADLHSRHPARCTL